MITFRSRATLESWLEEFEQMQYPVLGSLRVITQDSDEGADTGLVRVRLQYASTTTYIQPSNGDDHVWTVTMEPREDAVVLDAAQVQKLSIELSTVSALCTFLQTKSRDGADDSGALPTPA